MGIRTTSGPSATKVPPHDMGRQRMLTRRVHVRFSGFAPHTPARRSRGAARRRNRQAASDVAGKRRGRLPGQITYDSVDSSAPQSGADDAATYADVAPAQDGPAPVDAPAGETPTYPAEAAPAQGCTTVDLSGKVARLSRHGFDL